ncbi:hypothetical protein BJ508DRAFT_419437 [Ascobolus immersus RN42]|uniref:GPN-loop GTPase 2 n=1 Tax=Ascobolus immersus RN42 TaxID=1160509 RepID=A0A3N4HE95_ASCIM|nr:hypothetical protein BJ508DRAFT_419437 [Ascobolus immersus RN42]
MPFAQLVIGPPGSGKSTYTFGMHQYLSAIGRKSSCVNLDPANDHVQYPCAVDVRDLVKLEDVMDEETLGPNGSVVYAMECVEENWGWMEQRLKRLGEDYVIFDCPGQVELFTVHDSLRKIIRKIEKMGYRLTVINLSDSHYLTTPSKFISILLLSLRSMLNLPYPTLHVLSKIDLLSTYSPLPFRLDFYTEVQDLTHLIPLLEQEPGMKKFAKLNEAICELVENFGLVGFEVLAVEDRKSMTRLLQAIDRAGGYVFGSSEGAGDDVFQLAMRQGWGEEVDIQERWVDRKEEYDEMERREMEEARERVLAEGEAMGGM